MYRYLETVLATARGDVISVRLSRVLEVGRAHMWKRQYAWCLSRLLRRYRHDVGVYLLTKQQAEELLNRLDALCAELRAEKREKRRKASKQEGPRQEELILTCAPEMDASTNRERTPLVSFRLSRALLQTLDEYARRMNLTRSDVIRMAIRQMLEEMRGAAEEAAEEEEFEYIVVV